MGVCKRLYTVCTCVCVLVYTTLSKCRYNGTKICRRTQRTLQVSEECMGERASDGTRSGCTMKTSALFDNDRAKYNTDTLAPWRSAYRTVMGPRWLLHSPSASLTASWSGADFAGLLAQKACEPLGLRPLPPPCHHVHALSCLVPTLAHAFPQTQPAPLSSFLLSFPTSASASHHHLTSYF